MKHKLFKTSAYLIFIILVVLSCQREHSNIFDPKNNIDSLDLDLRIRQADSIVALRWDRPATVSFNGYNIFRRIQGESSFSLIASVSDTIQTYLDHSIQSRVRHEYYLNVQGDNLESPYSKKIQTIPGPANFWILDYWNFYIINLTYDLKHVITRHFAVWRPEQMSINKSNTVAVVTYPAYRYFEMFDPKTNAYLKGFDELEEPFGCVHEPVNDRFWITDVQSGVYTIDTESENLQLINNQIAEPTQIKLFGDDYLLVLSSASGQLHQMDMSGTIRDSFIELGDSVTYFDADPDRQIIYAISDSLLKSYSLYNNETKIFNDLDSLAIVRHSPIDGSIWIAQNFKNSAGILQLSATGERLMSLTGFEFVSDFDIVPSTGAIVVTDIDFSISKGTVYHFNADGTLIGKSDEAYYPYKVYVQ